MQSFCTLKKIKLLKGGVKTLLIGSIPSLLTNQITIPFNKLPCFSIIGQQSDKVGCWRFKFFGRGGQTWQSYNKSCSVHFEVDK